MKKRKMLREAARSLQSDDPYIRQSAAADLGNLKDANYIGILLEATRDIDINVRIAALEALGKIGKRDHSISKRAIEMLQDNDPAIRKEAIWLLGHLGDILAIPSIIEMLNDPDNLVRRYAIDALGRMGGADTIDGLLGALNDKDEMVRRKAAAWIKRWYSPPRN